MTFSASWVESSHGPTALCARPPPPRTHQSYSSPTAIDHAVHYLYFKLSFTPGGHGYQLIAYRLCWPVLFQFCFWDCELYVEQNINHPVTAEMTLGSTLVLHACYRYAATVVWRLLRCRSNGKPALTVPALNSRCAWAWDDGNSWDPMDLMGFPLEWAWQWLYHGDGNGSGNKSTRMGIELWEWEWISMAAFQRIIWDSVQ